MHYLVAQHHAIIVQTQFADAKAAALMTLSGVAALRAPLPDGANWAEIALSAALLLSVVLCLWAVIPRYRAPASGSADHFTWTALATGDHDALAHADFVRDGDFPELIGAIVASNVGGANVLRRKVVLIRWAFLAAIAAVALVALLAAVNAGWLPAVS